MLRIQATLKYWQFSIEILSERIETVRWLNHCVWLWSLVLVLLGTSTARCSGVGTKHLTFDGSLIIFFNYIVQSFVQTRWTVGKASIHRYNWIFDYKPLAETHSKGNGSYSCVDKMIALNYFTSVLLCNTYNMGNFSTKYQSLRIVSKFNCLGQLIIETYAYET